MNPFFKTRSLLPRLPARLCLPPGAGAPASSLTHQPSRLSARTAKPPKQPLGLPLLFDNAENLVRDGFRQIDGQARVRPGMRGKGCYLPVRKKPCAAVRADSQVRFERRHVTGKEAVAAGLERGMPVFTVPLFIPVGRRTCSAAEAVAYGLQQRKRAVVVGEQTQGEANPGLRFPASEKLCMIIPTVVNRDAVTGSNWEDRGVRPDRELPAETALAGALAEACRQLAAADSSKNIYAWLLPEYRAQLHPAIATDSFLLSIAFTKAAIRNAG